MRLDESDTTHCTTAVKVKKSEQPPIKPVTPYSLFVREQYKEGGPTGSFGERSTEIASRWKQLSDAEKQVGLLSLFFPCCSLLHLPLYAMLMNNH